VGFVVEQRVERRLLFVVCFGLVVVKGSSWWEKERQEGEGLLKSRVKK
jgi:hypothetical protein